MLKLSSAALVAANQTNTDTVWLLLLEINIDGEGEPLRIVKNTENVEWGGHIWQAFGFDVTEAKSDNKGTLSTLNVDVDNTTRDLNYYLEKGVGGTGSKVVLRCIRSDTPVDASADFEEYFSVTNTTVTEGYVRFTLGNSYPVKARRPWGRYLKNSCPFKYKGVRCGSTSSYATCNHTLSDCRKRGNSVRFGGFPGIPQGGLYV